MRYTAYVIVPPMGAVFGIQLDALDAAMCTDTAMDTCGFSLG